MAEGFITRRGGVSSEQALAPTINQISLNATSITFTITNNDTETATIAYRISSSTADGETLSLAGGATSSNITIGGLDAGTSYTIFSSANVQGKIKSNLTEFPFTTTVQFMSATGGTTLEYNESGKRYRSHTFTSSGNFVVNSLGSTSALNQVDYLIIAGGAGGGFQYGGGGGAGGYRTTNGTSGANSNAESKITVTAQSYGITVGGGGAGSSTGSTPGQNGSNSTAFGITSNGGGGGGAFANNVNGLVGGSGGGGSAGPDSSGSGSIGGNGTVNQGFNGGNGWRQNSALKGGGGGGAGQAGSSVLQTNETTIDAEGPDQSKGGDGLSSIIRTGSPEFRAGGGGGTLFPLRDGRRAPGGLGGGGFGSAGYFPNFVGTNGETNTGSGGGGNMDGSDEKNNPNAGGSGIVIIRYEIAPSA